MSQTYFPYGLAGTWKYPANIRFGPGAIAALPEACAAAGMARPLLVTDPGVRALPICDKALKVLSDAGIEAGIFSNVQPDPVGKNIDDGIAAFQNGGHDGVIAFGGGSGLDAGKSIALLCRIDGSIWDHEGAFGDVPADQVAPVVSVPTTAGTGSEVGRATVVTHEEQQVKKILLHPAMMPREVVADPELTLALPPFLTAATGMDALAHSLEALSGPFLHPMSDGIAVEGIRLVHDWLPVAFRDGNNIEARTAMMAAAIMGAVAFQKALGAIHALSHPIGAVHHLHHGMTNAVFMPYVVQFNRPAIEPAIERLARYLNLADPSFDGFQNWILDLRSTLAMPHTLKEAGVEDPDFDRLADMAFADPNAAENPVPVGVAELKMLFEKTYEGKL